MNLQYTIEKNTTNCYLVKCFTNQIFCHFILFATFSIFIDLKTFFFLFHSFVVFFFKEEMRRHKNFTCDIFKLKLYLHSFSFVHLNLTVKYFNLKTKKTDDKTTIHIFRAFKKVILRQLLVTFACTSLMEIKNVNENI